MRVRRLDDDGDMVLGHGAYDFHENTSEGVAQNVKTRLALWRGTWFLDTQEGTPWIQEVLGKRTAVEAVIRDRILGTPGVQEITNFEAIFDPDARRMTVTAEIATPYGETTFETTI